MKGNFAAAVRGYPEYRAIAEFYGVAIAERSRVPLINHIHEGLVVMDKINASLHSMRAWCLHPLFQADKDLAQTAQRLGPFWEFDPHCILLAMEYRYRANAWLSDKVTKSIWQGQSAVERVHPNVQVSGLPTPGDLEEVWHMLIADKVQNCKDFLTHHKGKHARSYELEIYFGHWLKALDVDEDEFNALCTAIDAA
ncbi:hypothetical protein GFK26_18315 [Variovorax paradoxus]|uniref:Uncharacterized protein n=1 Tax=Variovorax paradoxus TaxID=34073 RepID=A0A5Q0M4W6_VARPD|nr:hypothetical protein [Variovorax paradoxus]QFZ84583.1 hypothetical protein GFK26_18315 [Variovorax paradoxus]